MCGDESVPGSSKDVGQGQPRGKEERDVLDVNDLDDAITRRVEPYLSSLSRTIMSAAHDDDDPDFLIYLALQYALMDGVAIPKDILDAIEIDLTDPGFTPGMLPESRKWLAENRARARPQ